MDAMTAPLLRLVSHLTVIDQYIIYIGLEIRQMKRYLLSDETLFRAKEILLRFNMKTKYLGLFIYTLSPYRTINVCVKSSRGIINISNIYF